MEKGSSFFGPLRSRVASFMYRVFDWFILVCFQRDIMFYWRPISDSKAASVGQGWNQKNSQRDVVSQIIIFFMMTNLFLFRVG